MGKVFFGKIVHCKSFDQLEVIPDGYLAVKDEKVSTWLSFYGTQSKSSQRIIGNDNTRA